MSSNHSKQSLSTENTNRIPLTESSDGSQANVSGSEEPQARPPPAPSFPDGGSHAWLQCLGAFSLFFSSWGLVYSFGVFQEFYATHLLASESPSHISWIGSIAAFCLQVFTLFTGPLLDLGYLRLLLIMGTVLAVLGNMMTSIATDYGQFVLAQGVCAGLGYSCLFICSVGILPTYFSKKRSLAIGIAASGSIGAIIYVIMFHKLQPRIGFSWTVRTIAFVMLGTLVIPLLTMRQRFKPPKGRQLLDLSAFKEAPFDWYAVSLFFAFMGIYIPFFQIQAQAFNQQIVTGSLSFYLLPLLNVGSVFGRLIPNYIADKVGPMTTLAPYTLLGGVLAFTWIGITTSAGLIVFCILFGFFSGSYVSLSPSVTAVVSPNLAIYGTRTGMLAAPMGLGLLVGNPIAGAVSNDGFIGLKAFCGACCIASALALCEARFSKGGLSLNVRL
ncbi:MAG: hypothetical protein M1828_001509 [Chrysothrix sp. TS-e1954]|nr:MAG: hypothetical protein M1828_001509 [Chrysothrix sp. TS-e1954]